MLDKDNSHFDTSTDTVTDLINIKREGNILVTYCRMLRFLPRFCLEHTVDQFDSEGWFSCDRVIFFNVFSVFFVRSMQLSSKKTHFPGFLFLEVVHAPVRWSGKIK